jgi:hypothetical protein
VDYAFRIALGRSPTKAESASAQEYFEQRLHLLRNDPEAAGQIYPSRALGTDPIASAAWVGLGRVLMNVDEFITRE